MVSIEIYMKGELYSYSEQTIMIYFEYVEECVKNGINLTEEVRENMAKLYGYQSAEDVEDRLLKSRKCENS